MPPDPAPSGPRRDSPDRPIFVVGCARSGTTLLQLMLHSHPRIAIPPETRYLMEVYERRHKFGDLRKVKNRRKLAAYVVDRTKTKFDDLGLDREDVRAKIVEGPPTLGSALGIILQEYAARWDKPRWGDKRPNYIQHPEVLVRLFPDAQIVHIIRDGRDCVASLKRMPWWKWGTIASIYKWVAAMRSGAWARRHLPADTYTEVSYERLVAEPRAELERLCAFLGESFDEAMLEPHKVAGEAVPDNKTWHVRTREAVSAESVETWRQTLEPWELSLTEAAAARQLAVHGYRRSRTVPLPPPRQVYAYARYAVDKRKREKAWREQEARRAQRDRRPVAAQLTAAQRRLAERT
ncbi:MAG: sulfotransferase [Euzebyales bacterium]|nr:sulfotransferase [Euzebyales bacterium]MBA3621249.1 sulfotransferase [Euzebyales bacterium]